MEKDAKNKLIEAGEKLFAKKGLAGVSIRELAKAAGTNSALISYYFGGKEGLYEAVLEKQFSPIALVLQGIKEVPMTPTPTEKIIAYAKQVAVVHEKSPVLIRFIIAEILNPSKCFDPIIRKYIQRVYLFLHGTLEEGIHSGEFRRDLNPSSAVISLAGIMNFYFISRPIFQTFAPVDSRHKELYVMDAVKIFLNGVKENGCE